MALLAVALRVVQLSHAYEIHIDEVTYRYLAASVQHGQLPRLVDGKPFFLHPPGYYLLLAVWRAVVWRSDGGIFEELFVLRGLNVLLAGLTAWLLHDIGRRTMGLAVGLSAALLFAVDPFIIRHNSRGLLETATVALLLAGYLGLLRLQGRRRVRHQELAGTGLALGSAVVCKDFAAVLVALPLAAAAVRPIGFRRGQITIIALWACIPYLGWCAVCVLAGHGRDLWDAKTVGLLRLAGTRRETGFNAPGVPSLTEALLAHTGPYVMSYLLAAAGGAAAILLLRSQRREARLLGLLGASSVLLLGYAMLFGTIEEQFFYFLLIPAALTVPTVALHLLRRSRSDGRMGSTRTWFAGLALGTVLAANLAVWTEVRATPDDGWRRVTEWLTRNAPPGTGVAVTTIDAFVLPEFRTGYWRTTRQLRRNRVRYVIVPAKLVQQGYTALRPADVSRLRSAGRVVFRFQGPSNGTLEIIDLGPDGID